MNLYIIDYWVPFPSSEYGGVISLIASSDSEAFTLITSEDGLQVYPEYNDALMPAIVNAQKFKLSEEYQPIIVDAFTT